MDEARLAEIERGLGGGSHDLCDGADDIRELTTEVRRLRALLDENRSRWFDGKGPLRSSNNDEYCDLCKTYEAEPCEQRRWKDLHAIEN